MPIQRLATVALLLLTATAFTHADDTIEVTVAVGGLLQSEGGSWNHEDSPLTSPFGVDFNTAGDMFIVELEGGRVHVLDGSGSLRQIAGDGSKSYEGDGGPAQEATFNGMHNCAVTKNGDLFIADSWNHCIRKIDAATGTASTIAGTGEAGFSGDGGPAVSATFNFVMCITLSPDESVIHVADLKNRRVRAVSLENGVVTTVAGNGEAGVPRDGSPALASPLVDPRAVAADSKGNLYILERGGNALRVVRPDGTIHSVAGTGERGHRDGPAGQSMWGSPKHLCIDDRDNVYVADDTNGAIRKYDPVSHSVTTVLGRGFGDSRIRLSHPHGVCWEDGVLYVVDMGHNRILSIDAR